MRYEKSKEKNKVAITLSLCLGVIIIASFFTVKSSIDKVNSQYNRNDTGTQIEQPVNIQVPTVDSRDNVQKSETPDTPPSLSGFASPLNGSILSPFSPDTPVYSKTLDQYMTHYGIDIGAPLDTQVKAIAPGTVTAVYTDDRYGITIEITHDEGYKSVYSNLSVSSMVETGDVVDKGQVISGVGDTALFESLEASHIHFELLKDDIHVNPEDFIIFS